VGGPIYLDILQGAGERCRRGYEQMKEEGLKIQKAFMGIPDSPERKNTLDAAMR
jgi:hypothetical protein